MAKTLSSTTFAPAACAISETAAMSTSDCIGLDGVSKNTMFGALAAVGTILTIVGAALPLSQLPNVFDIGM